MKVLSSSFNVFMPFIYDVYKTAYNTIYEDLESNFNNYLQAFC